MAGEIVGLREERSYYESAPSETYYVVHIGDFSVKSFKTPHMARVFGKALQNAITQSLKEN